MKKYTKKQLEVMDNFIADLCELENKPRRLFHSLEEVAEKFNISAIPSIREAQDSYYQYRDRDEIFEIIFTALSEYKRERWKDQIVNKSDVERSYDDIRAVEEFIQLLIKNITPTLF